jgi:hypothetical protein
MKLITQLRLLIATLILTTGGPKEPICVEKKNSKGCLSKIYCQSFFSRF